MRRQLQFLWTILLILPAATPSRAATETRPWSQLGEVTKGKKIKMVLPSGTRVEGTAVGVDTEASTVEVTKTSNHQEIGKGNASIPRSSVSVIQTRQCSRKWRAILGMGLPAGLLGGTVAGMNAQSPAVDARMALGVGVAVAAGGAVGGYFIGRSLDCYVVEYRITPDSR